MNDSVPATPTGDPLLARLVASAAAILGLTDAQAALVVGMDGPAHVRPGGTSDAIAPTAEIGRRAEMLVSLCAALDAAVGFNVAQRKAWLGSFNADLGGVPRELIQTTDGLDRVLGYVLQLIGRS